MKNRTRSILLIEGALALMTVSLAVVTSAWSKWIEDIFHIDPDLRSGAIEWDVVLALWSAGVALSVVALRDWRRSRLAS